MPRKIVKKIVKNTPKNYERMSKIPRKIVKRIFQKCPEKLLRKLSKVPRKIVKNFIKNTSKNCENATDLCFSENHFDLTKKSCEKRCEKFNILGPIPQGYLMLCIPDLCRNFHPTF